MQPVFLRGFTIIELIVVIAILAILVSIAAPAISSRLSAGDVAKCRENVGQLLKLGMKYSNDMAHSNLLPVSGMSDDEDTETVNEKVGWWVALAQEMDETVLPRKEGGKLKISTIFRCPGDIRGGKMEGNAFEATPETVSYVSWTDDSEDPETPHSCIRLTAKQRLDELPWISDGLPVKGKSVRNVDSFKKMVFRDSVIDRHANTLVVGYASGIVKSFEVQEDEKADALFRRIAPVLAEKKAKKGSK